MNSQVKVLELEAALSKERQRLGELRKRHYQNEEDLELTADPEVSVVLDFLSAADFVLFYHATLVTFESNHLRKVGFLRRKLNLSLISAVHFEQTFDTRILGSHRYRADLSRPKLIGKTLMKRCVIWLYGRLFPNVVVSFFLFLLCAVIPPSSPIAPNHQFRDHFIEHAISSVVCDASLWRAHNRILLLFSLSIIVSCCAVEFLFFLSLPSFSCSLQMVANILESGGDGVPYPRASEF